MIDANTFSIAASLVAIVLAILAIVLSIWFFVLAKKTETQTSSSLTKIETQADSLQKLTGRWMDRLTKYVTSDRPNIIDESIPQFLSILSQLPQTITATITQVSSRDSIENQAQLIANLYIALYFCTAQTNYWCQSYFPRGAEFDENNNFHQTVKRIIDISHSDFITLSSILANIDQTKLTQSNIAHLFTETKDYWCHSVKSTTDILIAQQK